MSIKASWAYGGPSMLVHTWSFLCRLLGCWCWRCFPSMTSQCKSDKTAWDNISATFLGSHNKNTRHINTIEGPASPALVRIINKAQTKEYCILIYIHVIILVGWSQSADWHFHFRFKWQFGVRQVVKKKKVNTVFMWAIPNPTHDEHSFSNHPELSFVNSEAFWKPLPHLSYSFPFKL